MAATNDTIDGLLAEFRGYSAGMPASYHITMSWADFRRMLDRFDAAHRREVDEAERRANHAAMKNVSETLAKVGPLYDAESIGNAAKLREALKKCLLYIACAESVGVGAITLNDKVKLDPKKIIKAAKEALAATRRKAVRSE